MCFTYPDSVPHDSESPLTFSKATFHFLGDLLSNSTTTLVQFIYTGVGKNVWHLIQQRVIAV